jgi:hypothetical protein
MTYRQAIILGLESEFDQLRVDIKMYVELTPFAVAVKFTITVAHEPGFPHPSGGVYMARPGCP